MKTSLRGGGLQDFNVYSVGFVAYVSDSASTKDHLYTPSFMANRGLLGYGAYPWEYQHNPTDDGVVFLFSTVPGGSSPGHGMGRVKPTNLLRPIYSL